jgi:LuxR family transcriptional regulator, maltose regulon positive regulatory protein
VLVEHAPGRGPQVVLAARREPALGLSRLRIDRRVRAFDTGDLAMSPLEASALASSAGAELERSACDLLVERTEGWPAGLYLAALRLRGEADPSSAATTFVGSDRDVSQYFRDEVLRSLAPESIDFLTRTSILEQLSGPLCDAVLRLSGSGGLLEELHRSILFIVAVDKDQEWYQCHLLFREVLEAEFRKRDPMLKAVLHGRASQWFEHFDNIDAAVHHAQMTGDEDRVDGLIYGTAPALLLRGQNETVQRWLDPYTTNEIAKRPALVVTAAWHATSSGEMARFKHWASVAELAPEDAALPDGTPLFSAVALLRAAIGVDGFEAMRRDAALAYESDREDSALRALACWVEGCALRLLGQTQAARVRLQRGITIGRIRAPAMLAQCLAQLAAIAVEENDWGGARNHIDEAIQVVDDHQIGERPAMAMLYGVAALVHAHENGPTKARAESKHAEKLLEELTDVGPWAAAEARRLLALAALSLGDVRAARTLLHQARATLAKVPDAEPLLKRLEDVAERIDLSAAPLGTAASQLTPAEMRLLRLLATHITQKEIAAELFVSPNTVKTQAISIYRKLGVGSRTHAVDAARALGILDT